MNPMVEAVKITKQTNIKSKKCFQILRCADRNHWKPRSVHRSLCLRACTSYTIQNSILSSYLESVLHLGIHFSIGTPSSHLLLPQRVWCLLPRLVTVPLPFCVHLLWGKLLGHQEPHWNTQSPHLLFPITRPDPSFPSGTSATFGERHWRTSLSYLSLSFPTDLMVLGVFSTVMQQQSVLSQFRKHPAEVNNQMSPSAILTLLSRFFLAGHRKWRSAWHTALIFYAIHRGERTPTYVETYFLYSCS